MHGYDPSTYGEAMADVYDDWYGTAGDDGPVLDTAAAVACLATLAGAGPVLELGVGTGRLAVPLAATGLTVDGVDASPAMIDRLRSKPGGDRVAITLGDMAGPDPVGPFSLVFVAVNTFFNLVTLEAQRTCLANVAARLRPGGRFVIEAFLPDDPPRAGHHVAVRSIEIDRVVLNVTTSDPSTQTAFGQFIEISEKGGVRLRPWLIRWATLAQLDELAGQAGMALEHRWARWSGDPLHDDSSQHVSVYRLGKPA